MLVEVAGACFGVEHWARLVVGELLEEDGGFVVFGQDAGGEVAWEPGLETDERFGDAGVDAGGLFGLGLGETFTETVGILLRYREDAVAALRTAGAAGEVLCAALDGGG